MEQKVDKEWILSRINEGKVYIDNGSNNNDDTVFEGSIDEDWLGTFYSQNTDHGDACDTVLDGYNDFFDEFVDGKDKYRENKLKRQIIESKEWAPGVEKMKKFLYYSLKLVYAVFPFTDDQFEVFWEVLPATQPIFFGKSFYTQYKSCVYKILGLPHNKLFIFYIGSRRDGKSILQSVIDSGILAIAETFDGSIFFMPLGGPGEDTGQRAVNNINMMFQIKRIQEEFKHLKIKASVKKITVVDTKTGVKKMAVAKAPTDGSMRGINSNFDSIDETTFIEYDKFDKYYITRMKDEGLSAFSISTPNYSEHEFKKFYKETPVVRSIIKDQLCPTCLLLRETHNLSLEECQEICHKKGHRAPPNHPWKSASNTNAWNTYHSEKNLAMEEFAVEINDKKACFKSSKIDVFVSFRAPTPINSFDLFCVTCDPADKGASFNGMSVFGIKGKKQINYQVLFGTKFRLPDEMYTAKEVASRCITIVKKLISLKLLYNPNKQKILFIPEFFIHIGHEVYEYIKTAGYGNYFIVIKALNNYKSCGVPLTRKIKEEMIAYFRELLNTNRIKFNDAFFTTHKKGIDYIVGEFGKELKNLVRNEKGKITGKDGKDQDDLAISMIMGPYWIRKILNVENRELNKQLYTSRMTIY